MADIPQHAIAAAAKAIRRITITSAYRIEVAPGDPDLRRRVAEAALAAAERVWPHNPLDHLDPDGGLD